MVLFRSAGISHAVQGVWQQSVSASAPGTAACAVLHNLAFGWQLALLAPSSAHHAHRQLNTTLPTNPTDTLSEAGQRQQPEYKQIRARIFGEPIKPDERTGRRVLARPLQGAKLASWYFMPPRMPGSHNEEREYVMLRKLNKRQKKKSEEAEATTKKKKK